MSGLFITVFLRVNNLYNLYIKTRLDPSIPQRNHGYIFLTFFGLRKIIGQTHTSQVYFAWMKSIDNFDTKSPLSRTQFSSQESFHGTKVFRNKNVMKNYIPRDT